LCSLRHQLDTSVEVSGPHDFTVRNNTIRLMALQHPSHPAPNVRDDREAPLLWARDDNCSIAVSTKSKTEFFSRRRLDKTGKSVPPRHSRANESPAERDPMPDGVLREAIPLALWHGTTEKFASVALRLALTRWRHAPA
jgi:hypothetical protein